MEIRYFEMAYEDIPQVSAMEAEYFSQPWSEASIAHYLDSGNTIFLVAKNDDADVVGYCALMRMVDESDLVSIAVHKDYRNMGIAREILDISYDLARKNGIGKIHLEVRESNEAAICLYESEGFLRDGIRKGFYDRPKEDALLYTKEL